MAHSHSWTPALFAKLIGRQWRNKPTANTAPPAGAGSATSAGAAGAICAVRIDEATDLADVCSESPAVDAESSNSRPAAAAAAAATTSPLDPITVDHFAAAPDAGRACPSPPPRPTADGSTSVLTSSAAGDRTVVADVELDVSTSPTRARDPGAAAAPDVVVSVDRCPGGQAQQPQPDDAMEPADRVTSAGGLNAPRKSLEYEDINTTGTEVDGSAGGSGSLEHKRKSSFRRWLTNPMRKLSMGRMDGSKGSGGTAAGGQLGGGQQPPTPTSAVADKSSTASENASTGSGVNSSSSSPSLPPSKSAPTVVAGKTEQRKHSKFSMTLMNLFHVGDDSKKADDHHPPLAQQEDLTSEDRADTPIEADGSITVESRPADTISDTDSSHNHPSSAAFTPLCADQTEATSHEGNNGFPTPQGLNDERIGLGGDEVATEAVTAAGSDPAESSTDATDASQTAELQLLPDDTELKQPQEQEAAIGDQQPSTTDSDTATNLTTTDVAESDATNGQAENAESVSVAASVEPTDPAMEGMTEEEKTIAKNLQKRGYVIMELIDTEKDYVKDLGLIVEGYMKIIQTQEVPMPSGMEGKDKIVFGNIHQIYDWHRETFQPELNRCSDEPDRLGGAFVRYERRLYMYVKYCENKPKSEYIVAEYIDYFEELRQKMGHRLQLPDLLIKPIQRIMKYQLMLKDILKHSERAQQDTTDLKKALQVMQVVPKAANDMMNVGRLQGFDGKITAQGKLLLQDTLMIVEHQMIGGRPTKVEKQTLRDRRVFLFEQIIIFSEEIDKRKNNLSSPGYIYKHSIKINNMTLDAKADGEPLRFILIDKSPGSDFALLCQALNEEIKQNWICHIRSLLDMQGDFLRALQSPIAYQKELSKELSAPEFDNFQPPPQPAQHGCLLRKTNSQPHSTMHSTLPPVSKRSGGSAANKKQDSLKYSRTASVPTPLEGKQAMVEKVKGEDGKSRCKSGSPQQPKRNIFAGLRSTLRSSSKSRSQEDLSRIGGNEGGNTSGTGGTENAENSTKPAELSGDPMLLQENAPKCSSQKVEKSHSKDDGNTADVDRVLDPAFVFEVTPTIQQPLKDVVVTVGSTALLLCKLCGRPRPAVEWTGPGRSRIVSDERTLLGYSEHGVLTLELRDVRADQCGEYTCTVTGTAGSVSTVAHLTVVAADDDARSNVVNSNSSAYSVTADSSYKVQDT